MLSMRSAFDVFLVLFAGVWLILAAVGVGRLLKRGRRTNWLVAGIGLLVFIGSAGFFAEGLSAEGIIRLPKSYEWPAGYVSGVTATSHGKYVVPLVTAGRVQVYDAHWHFLCGWNVEALGGEFTVAATTDGTVEVFTARGNHRFSFTENGDLISASTAAESYDALPSGGQSVVVPTSPLLWAFSSPLISLGVMVLGLIGLRVAKKLIRGPSHASI